YRYHLHFYQIVPIIYLVLENIRVVKLVIQEKIINRSGDYSKEVTPVPISNTAVKLFCADGSRDFVSARVGRRQATQQQLINRLVNKLFFISVKFIIL